MWIFEVINMDLVRLFYMVGYAMHAARLYIIVQASVPFLYFSHNFKWIFAVNLVLFCPHLDSFYCSVGEGLPIQVVLLQ